MLLFNVDINKRGSVVFKNMGVDEGKSTEQNKLDRPKLITAFNTIIPDNELQTDFKNNIDKAQQQNGKVTWGDVQGILEKMGLSRLFEQLMKNYQEQMGSTGTKAQADYLAASARRDSAFYTSRFNEDRKNEVEEREEKQ